MLSVLGVVLPIFALIFAGWAIRRLGVLSDHATGEINRFVVYLALPALLFDIIARRSGSRASSAPSAWAQPSCSARR